MALGVGFEVDSVGLSLNVTLCGKTVWSRGQESDRPNGIGLPLGACIFCALFHAEPLLNILFRVDTGSATLSFWLGEITPFQDSVTYVSLGQAHDLGYNFNYFVFWDQVVNCHECAPFIRSMASMMAWANFR